MPSNLAQQLDSEMVRHLVATAITCPNTGEVLDVRTCVVLEGPDGDPRAVLSQQGWRNVVAKGKDQILAAGSITARAGTVEAPR